MRVTDKIQPRDEEKDVVRDGPCPTASEVQDVNRLSVSAEWRLALTGSNIEGSSASRLPKAALA